MKSIYFLDFIVSSSNKFILSDVNCAVRYHRNSVSFIAIVKMVSWLLFVILFMCGIANGMATERKYNFSYAG